MNKSDLVNTLGILLSLGKSSTNNLMALEKETLQEMYDNYIINAKASNAQAFQQLSATRRPKTATKA